MAFVNFDRWMDLNPEEKERMGQQAVAGAQPAMNKAYRAMGDVAAGYGNGSESSAFAAAQEKQKLLNGTGGLAGLMQKPGGTPVSAFDAALAGGSKSVGAARSKNLGQMMTDAQTAGQKMQEQRAQMQADVAARNTQHQQDDSDARLKAAYQQQRDWRIRNGQPQGAEEYAEYSDNVQQNRQRRPNRSRNFFDFFGR